MDFFFFSNGHRSFLSNVEKMTGTLFLCLILMLGNGVFVKSSKGNSVLQSYMKNVSALLNELEPNRHEQHPTAPTERSIDEA